MSQRKIKQRHRSRHIDPPESISPTAATQDWKNFVFTPVLNAAFAFEMKGLRYSATERVNFWLCRYSWGNWCSHAVSDPNDRMAVAIGDEDRGWFEDLLFGNGPCPLCGERAERQRGFPKGFRWHRICVALAYARDAIKLGDAEQKEWATHVIARDGQA